MTRACFTIAVVFCMCITLAPCLRADRAIPADNLSYPVLLTAGASSGSGVFVNIQNATFLVTAAHVLFKPNTQPPTLYSAQVSTRSYSGDTTDSTPLLLNLDMAVLERAGEVVRHPTQDLAVVRVGVSSSTDRYSTFVTGVTSASIPAGGLLGVGEANILRFRDVSVGNEVYLFGYPVSLGLKPLPQMELDRPLLRRGVVAGTHRFMRTIILDCPAYPGNSGGPVIQVDLSPAQRRYQLIGIVVEFIPDARGANSGYTVVVPSDDILELIAKGWPTPTPKTP